MNKQQLENYIKLDYSTHRIAKETNKSQCSVRYWLKKFGLKTNHKSIKMGGGKKSTRIIEGGIIFRICPLCKTKKIENSENFYTRSNQKTHSYCKKCASEGAVKRLINYKIMAVEYKGGKCETCGYNKYYGALEFHHLDSSKKDFSISNSNRNFESIKTELDKCIMLCANCHREIHRLVANNHDILAAKTNKVVETTGIEPATVPLKAECSSL